MHGPRDQPVLREESFLGLSSADSAQLCKMTADEASVLSDK